MDIGKFIGIKFGASIGKQFTFIDPFYADNGQTRFVDVTGEPHFGAFNEDRSVAHIQMPEGLVSYNVYKLELFGVENKRCEYQMF